MAFAPVMKFDKAGNRQFDEVNTGDIFNLRQVRRINYKTVYN